MDDPLARQLFCITLWKIWKGRNDLIFNKATFNPISIASKSAKFVDDYNAAVNKIPKPHPTTPTSLQKAPDAETIKINTDAGCFENDTTGWGFITRDSSGRVQFAATLWPRLCAYGGL